MFFVKYHKDKLRKKLKQKVLLIDNNDSFTYNLVETLRQCGAEVVVANTSEDIVGMAADYNSIMLSPGPDIPREYPNMTALIDTWHKTKNILGICLGHQAIGVYFGMALKQMDCPLYGVGTELLLLIEDEIYSGLPSEIRVGRYHSWALEKTGASDELLVTSTDRSGTIMSIRHRRYNVRGLQYHPESYITSHGKEIIGNWLCNSR